MRNRNHARACLGLVTALGSFAAGLPASAQEGDVAGLRAAAKASPGDAAASLALGKALRRAGRFQEAAVELQRGSLLGGALKAGLAPQLHYEVARTRIEQRDLHLALRACDGLGPSTALSNACRADAYLMQNRATDALPLVERALKADGSNYETKVAQGRALLLTGRVADGEAALRAAIAGAEARPEAHRYLGAFLLTHGKREAGLTALRRSLAADPNDPEVVFEIGMALGTTKEGRDMLAKATRIRPPYAAAHAELARVSFELGDVAAAESSATSAIKLDPKLWSARIALGRVRVTQRRWDDALREGEAAKKLLSNSSAAELVLADAHAGKGDIDLAIESYQKAFSADRTDPAPLVRAARACLSAGRVTTARAFADKATAEFPKLAEAWIELGDAAAKQNDKTRAKAAYEQALKLDGPFDRDAVKRKLAAVR
jgi:tetratricopeptide (TPR) repeat protein